MSHGNEEKNLGNQDLSVDERSLIKTGEKPVPLLFMSDPAEGSSDRDQALRYNDGKPRLSFVLSAPNAIAGVTKVLEHGAEKYSRDNWKKGLPYTEVADSLIRHLTDFLNGEDIDKDSGYLLNIDQVVCNALFLAEFVRTRPEFDDRSKTLSIGGNI